MQSTVRLIILSSFGAVACMGRADETPKDSVSAYGLAAGQELRYEVRLATWFDGSDGKPDIPREQDGSPKYERYDLRLFVSARNDDGSFRVVTKTKSAADYPLLSQADLFPNGRVNYNAAALPMLAEDTLQFVFPRLAANEHDLRQGWQEVNERSGARWSYQIDDDEIRAALEGPLDRVALGKATVRYCISRANNLPELVELNGYWPRYKETNYHEVVFKEVIQHGEQWAKEFDSDARRYFDFAKKQRRRLGNNQTPLALAAREPQGATAMLDEARTALAAVFDEVEEPIFRDHLQHEIKQFDERRGLWLEGAKRFSPIAGQPSPAWVAADLDGNEHRLEQYRGKVLVLDFWFRQCNYCIRAMPQVDQAADHFRAAKAPVVFLGISTDSDQADARFVAQELDLSYPVLWSKDMAEKYGVKGFPTFLVIDSEGTVRGIFTGYSSTLREDLIDCVGALLDK